MAQLFPRISFCAIQQERIGYRGVEVFDSQIPAIDNPLECR
ncbi:hypothetical protein [Altericroceibacterium xinjiangense]|nr:hypothetical protein [Altericroceibacterium xinjiangense]